ncbi:MAG: DNA/RNA non-specific endonuclease [Anaerolineales bacterium]|nr:DNA/RNA non-specific endonuclease [Anaerolineales bacterium]
MFDQSGLKSETRYGMPAADQILTNRHYTIGYSYYFRQAKWALEIVDPDTSDVQRADNFRPDFRIPERFRADLVQYEGSGFDRGHLVASANQFETEIQNSETFLLSNMSPQHPKFNRGIWKNLEDAVRDLNAKKEILETYVICGPIFNFDMPIKTIDPDKEKENTLPIPHGYFKSILTENDRGSLHMWSFLIPNEDTKKQPISDFQVPARKVERYSGFLLWERLMGKEIDKEKEKIRPMWK